MFNRINSILSAAVLSFAVLAASDAFAGSPSSFSCPKGKLSDKQCTAVRKDLDIYTKLVKALFGNGPLVKAVIALANKDVDKLCPQPTTPPVDPSLNFECTAIDISGQFVVSLGLDTSGQLVNANPPDKFACMSQAACANLASQAYVVQNSFASERCADPSDMSTVHLTDAEVQTKVDALLGH